MRHHFLILCFLLALRRAPSGVATFKGILKVAFEVYLMYLAGGATERIGYLILK
jgi:hypothetical protein